MTRFESMAITLNTIKFITEIPTHNEICKDIQGHIRQLKTSVNDINYSYIV